MFLAHIYRAGCDFTAFEESPEKARALLMRGLRKFFRANKIYLGKDAIKTIKDETFVKEVRAGDCLCDSNQMFRENKFREGF